jgi:hypothetical protein
LALNDNVSIYQENVKPKIAIDAADGKNFIIKIRRGI